MSSSWDLFPLKNGTFNPADFARNGSRLMPRSAGSFRTPTINTLYHQLTGSCRIFPTILSVRTHPNRLRIASFRLAWDRSSNPRFSDLTAFGVPI